MNEVMSRSNATGMAAAMESAEIAEIQAKMILARNFPRDISSVREYIAGECSNKELAEKATYEFPRGDSVVKGASIRLLECIARHWGNILSGVKEITSNDREATVKAFCWDLQTNFADEKVFTVPYVRNTKKHGKIPLTDERDKYEMMANMAARRKRACMQAVIPQFIVDEAVELCQKTLENALKGEDIEVTKAKMLTAFQKIAPWVTEADFETVCGKDFAHLSIKDIVKLRALYNAINEGFVKPEVAFKKVDEKAVSDEATVDTLAEVNDLVGGGNGADEG